MSADVIVILCPIDFYSDEIGQLAAALPSGHNSIPVIRPLAAAFVCSRRKLDEH
jgi:hypothetical protein